MSIVEVDRRDAVAIVRLNDPEKRNALGLSMFEGLDAALNELGTDDRINAVVLCGAGKVFCAGFDLVAAADDPGLVGRYIHRLSGVNRALRRLPQPVVAAVHGAAVAGGCALLSACDFVFIAGDARIGYPVHAIGISPAVTIPTLCQALPPGAARSLLLSGELIDGRAAHSRGLATDVCASPAGTVLDEALASAQALAAKPPGALRITKAWLNELDGSLADGAFDETAGASAAAAQSEEAAARLSAWKRQNV